MVDDLTKGLQSVLVERKLSCAMAFREAEKRGLSPRAVGDWANEVGVRISHCQLGLFGYGSKATGQHKIVQPATYVEDNLAEAIRSRTREGIISCADIWEIAAQHNITKLAAAAAVEALGLRVHSCQLGCF